MSEQPVCPFCVDPAKTHARHFSLCEHHSMHTPEAMAEARERRDQELAEAEQRGAASVLREIAALDPLATFIGRDQCFFCDGLGRFRAYAWEFAHTDNCLCVRALAAGRDEAR